MQNLTPVAIVALGMELLPAIGFGFVAQRIGRAVQRWPLVLRVAGPPALVLPYVLVSFSQHMFQWKWFTLYAALPAAIAGVLARAVTVDGQQRGNWRDAIILLGLGLAVDLRWFDSAWPVGLRALNELLLVDAGLYGFLAVRQLSGTGFDFHLQWSDWKTGLRELVFFTPLVLVLGLALGFIHPHSNLPGLGSAALRWVAIFFFTAVPEELFFRAWRLLKCDNPNTVDTFQLALRVAGYDRWYLLWTGLARAAEGSGFRDHAHLRGLDVGAVVLSGPCTRASGWR